MEGLVLVSYRVAFRFASKGMTIMVNNSLNLQEADM